MIGNGNGIAVQIRSHEGNPTGESLIFNSVHARIRLDHVTEERAQATGTAANIHDAPVNAAAPERGRRRRVDHVVAHPQSLPGPALEREIWCDVHAAAVGIRKDAIASDNCVSTRDGSQLVATRTVPAVPSELRS